MNTKISRRSFTTLVLIFTFFAIGNNPVIAAINHVFTVNSINDTFDANAGDGRCADTFGNCTLRAAVQEADFTSVTDTINFALPLPATINLTLGQLSIVNDLVIVGPGARKLTVQRSTAPGTNKFRIFFL